MSFRSLFRDLPPLPSGLRAWIQRLPSPSRNPFVWIRRVLIALSALVIVAVITGLGAAAYAWKSMELPAEQPLDQSTILTDANGQRLALITSGENRVNVRLSDTPPVVTQALLAAEDKSFYEHSGVNPSGMARALWVDLRQGEYVQGGSTITQQYVKLTYVGREVSIERKFKEAILAVKLENKLSKDQILERYLNAVYFGRGAYGVQAASRQYYGKDAKNIDLAEASYLIGLIPGPEIADAYAQPATATKRRSEVLRRMVANGVLPQAAADAVEAKPLASYVIPRAKQEPTVVSGDKGTQFLSLIHI